MKILFHNPVGSYHFDICNAEYSLQLAFTELNMYWYAKVSTDMDSSRELAHQSLPTKRGKIP